MKLDLNFKPSSPDGELDQDLSKILAIDLLRGNVQKEEDIIKMFDWGMKLGRGEVIDLDRADQKKLRELVVQSKQLTTFIKGHLLNAIENDKHDNKDIK